MDKIKILNRIKQLYLENKNIIKYLKELDERESNSTEDIMISYDFQAGTYVKSYKEDSSFKKKYCTYLSDIIENLGDYGTILEVGIGEGTTLGPLLNLLRNKSNKAYGFDISWSRLKYAKRFLNELGVYGAELFMGDLFSVPLKDNSIDIVYTSHSVEPNGGKEKEALMELYRITNKYLILLEPSYEFANGEGKKRMLNHGYVTNLYSTAKELGYDIIDHRLFPISANPLNPTGLIIIRKNSKSKVIEPLCCPITKTSLIKKNNAYFSKDSLIAYPIIDEIPCLLPQNAIIATKFLD
ncbi:methyltransferase domain-containing protein [Coprococcus sp. MSK.21.13]|nr:methyltransferase domain-containing protein [Coprococcus sp. MSK.21.13]